jgi:hypothetical protein
MLLIFTGNVIINFRLQNATDRLLFHMDRSLQVLGQIELSNTESLGNTFEKQMEGYANNQFYHIVFKQQLSPVGVYRLNVSFRGTYGEETNLVGFHKLTYVENGLNK